MELVIHRSAKEIGGLSVELCSGSRRLILDLGLPLSNADGTPFRLDRNLEELLDYCFCFTEGWVGEVLTEEESRPHAFGLGRHTGALQAKGSSLSNGRT